MRGRLGLLAIVVAVVAGLLGLREATEYRGGTGAPGASTAVTFRVETRVHGHDKAVSARALWQTCVNTINWKSAGQPQRLRGDTYRAEITPSLTADTKRRLRGCLNEATLPLVRGHVVSTVDAPATN